MTDLVPYSDNVLSTYDEVEKAARAMAGSGFFSDTRQASQAVVKILAAKEIGFGPFAGMTGINIIQGKPAFGANIMAAAVKRSGRYNYIVREMTDNNCEILFMERLDGKWTNLGSSSFSLADAKKAGTKNLDKFPRNMLFARALSNGVRWFTPDVMNGSIVYTPEELGAETDVDGNIIEVPNPILYDAQPSLRPSSSPKQPLETPSPIIIPQDSEPDQSLENSSEMSYEQACAITNSRGAAYGSLDSNILKFMSGSLFKAMNEPDRSEQEKAEYSRKLTGIETILKHREA